MYIWLHIFGVEFNYSPMTSIINYKLSKYRNKMFKPIEYKM